LNAYVPLSTNTHNYNTQYKHSGRLAYGGKH
jgi:hypothetical protein